MARLEKVSFIGLEGVEAPKFSLIIPVFNESEIIEENLRILIRFLERELAESYQLIVCDDSSQDNTYPKLVKLKAEKPDVVLLRFPRRIGKGGTVKEAIRRAEGEFVVVMDADLSTKLEHLPQMISFLERNGGVLIGERRVSSRYTQGYLRTILSLVFNLLTRILFRTGIRDHQCGFKGMTRKAALFFAEKIGEDGYLFDTELIFLAKKHGFPLSSMEVEWEEKRNTRRPCSWWIRNAVKMLGGLVKLRLKHL